LAREPGVAGLTTEQVKAAASGEQALFLVSSPGSGKTTVASHRYAALRFGADARKDPRAVLAVSFTHAATRELRQRVRRTWGAAAVSWPHRISTLDTVMFELITDLLTAGLIRWPGGHTRLQVRNTWKGEIPHRWGHRRWGAVLDAGGGVVVAPVERVTDGASLPDWDALERRLAEGVCTHDDIRRVLEGALTSSRVRRVLRERLGSRVRALIVDEVFDANELDLAVVGLIRESGASVTIIGDPWQALYSWRGATPDKVPDLIAAHAFVTLPLSKSFRWDTVEQEELGVALRQRLPVVLPAGTAADVDVVLGRRWARSRAGDPGLWDVGDSVLPLALKSTPSTPLEAASTLLLDRLVRDSFQLRAAFLEEACRTLRLSTENVVAIQGDLGELLGRLADATTRPQSKLVLQDLIALVATVSNVSFPSVAADHVSRALLLRARLVQVVPLIPGLTVHQAKGMEWQHVGVVLSAAETGLLAAGLDPDDEPSRCLYVACTRARRRTVHV
jgi:DNA helicase-2/ATP-dependent DNA helicase PcrA